MLQQPTRPPDVMLRQPVAAGRFYAREPEILRRDVAAFLAGAVPLGHEPTRLAMAPHAGYIYSGAVAGSTFGAANLAGSMVLLGPNHTGRGRPLAVWDAGGWNMPGGIVPVDAALAAALLTAETRLAADVVAHLGEHALEVQLPFLQARNPGCRIVPVVVSEPDPYVLQEVAESMAGVIRAWEKPVSIIVSSDMSHYVSQETARRLDALALARILALDPEGLYRVVHEMEISMCGVLPMVLGLFLARALGAHDAVLTAYATSGEVSGDYEHVVGYAGVLVQ